VPESKKRLPCAGQQRETQHRLARISKNWNLERANVRKRTVLERSTRVARAAESSENILRLMSFLS
jgi:hypothetical protein